MRNKLLIILAAFSLSGCFGMGSHVNTPTRTEWKVVIPGDKYFECDEVLLPDPATLSDAQVATLVNDLVQANRICHNNSVATKEYLEAAKKELEKRNNN